MATDERNFRSAYYEKVASRSVEEKKSLEIILKDKPLDRRKLQQYCLAFCVPIAYRNLLWKLLLDVVPVHVEAHPFIMNQRKQEYADLMNAVKAMKLVDNSTPKSQVFLVMWLLQTGKLTFDLNLFNDKGFSAISQVFMQFFDDDVDVYWLSKNFYLKILDFQNDIPALVEGVYSLLQKEDPALFKYLESNNILDNLPMEKWFYSCFAGILNETALGKIWDKFVGGSLKILCFVAANLLMINKAKLLKCNDWNEALSCVKEISDEIADVIANKSIDMWQQYGTHLVVDVRIIK
ncbi:TBC1 domain family member 7 [Aethina tumida]|uniref:TBC1 domain family member 7 n=1 Tax=Aethina tumida TaxID=116153 RepID=UPI00096B5054|nr:TBC1 domain family member 7 [Aethina tumida]